MKLDRNVSWAGKFEDNEERIKEHWHSSTVKERLEAAFYLNSIAYNFDINNPPRMDRTVFSMRKNK
jgi:hypothetical protein